MELPDQARKLTILFFNHSLVSEIYGHKVSITIFVLLIQQQKLTQLTLLCTL
jgi:hypothetical protein